MSITNKVSDSKNKRTRNFLLGVALLNFVAALWFVSTLSARNDQPVTNEEEPVPFEALQVSEDEMKPPREELPALKHVPVSEMHTNADLNESVSLDETAKKGEDTKRLVSLYGETEDVTRQAQDVRTTKVKAGVGLNVTNHSMVGVEASRDFYDQGDAGAWNKDTSNPEEAAQVKYKVNF